MRERMSIRKKDVESEQVDWRVYLHICTSKEPRGATNVSSAAPLHSFSELATSKSIDR